MNDVCWRQFAAAKFDTLPTPIGVCRTHCGPKLDLTITRATLFCHTQTGRAANRRPARQTNSIGPGLNWQQPLSVRHSERAQIHLVSSKVSQQKHASPIMIRAVILLELSICWRG